MVPGQIIEYEAAIKMLFMNVFKKTIQCDNNCNKWINKLEKSIVLDELMILFAMITHLIKNTLLLLI